MPATPAPRPSPPTRAVQPAPTDSAYGRAHGVVADRAGRTTPSQELADLRLTIEVLGDQLSTLTDRVHDLEKEVQDLRRQKGDDDVDERIVTFLAGLGGVKLNGMAIAENLGLQPGPTQARLSKLAHAGRITAHREQRRHTLWSVPLR